MSEASTTDDALVPFAGDEVVEPAAEETRQVILFEACGERFALPVEAVREVQLLSPLTRVPTAAPEILGIVNLRGRVLTLFDLGPCLGIPAGTGPATHAIVLDLHDPELTVGLAVEQIGEVRRVPLSALETPPTQEDAPTALEAVFEADGQVVGLLDSVGVFAKFLPDWGIAPARRAAG